MYDDDTEVRPDGLTVRRMRHERAWSPRKLIDAIGERRRESTGVATSISPNLLAGIEERDETVPYSTLCLVAGAFDCDPIDLVRDESRNGRARETDLKDGEPVVTYDERFRLE